MLYYDIHRITKSVIKSSYIIISIYIYIYIFYTMMSIYDSIEK